MIWKCQNEWTSDPFRKPGDNKGELFAQNESSRVCSGAVGNRHNYIRWSSLMTGRVASRWKRKCKKFGAPDGKGSIFRPIGTYIWLGHLTEWVAEVCWK